LGWKVQVRMEKKERRRVSRKNGLLLRGLSKWTKWGGTGGAHVKNRDGGEQADGGEKRVYKGISSNKTKHKNKINNERNRRGTLGGGGTRVPEIQRGGTGRGGCGV